jgi:hypothetical protein
MYNCGTDGSNKFGIWSHFGDYAAKFGDNSAYSEFAELPPTVIVKDGDIRGALSVSTLIATCGTPERFCTIKQDRILWRES